MKMNKYILCVAFCVVSGMLFVGCDGGGDGGSNDPVLPPTYDIRGTWLRQWVPASASPVVYLDSVVVAGDSASSGTTTSTTLSGPPSHLPFTWVVSGSSATFTYGHFVWSGEFDNANRISGTSYDSGSAYGTFVMTRQ